MQSIGTSTRAKRLVRAIAKVLMFCALGLCLVWLGLWWCLRLPMQPAVAPASALQADFIWGMSSSAFQSEGGEIDSNVLRMNKDLLREGKQPQDPYGKAVDFRHRYREDIALARQLGTTMYRISISWARVEPKKGQIDAAELAYYDDVMAALKEAGIQPLITLDHFAYPGWVADQGGWTNAQTVDDFVKYADLIARRYHTQVRYWLTFNEALADIAIDISYKASGVKDASAIRRNVVSAHRRSYELIHRIDPQAMVTSNIAWLGDTTFSRVINEISDWTFLDQIADRMDYVAVDYYTNDIMDLGRGNANWYPDPPGLYRALRFLSERFPTLPLMVAENGMATDNGKPRADGVLREDALRDSVYWVQRARADGINVMGYFVWSLTDNFEWGSYSPRFGLYTVNALTDPTLARSPTAAVPAYKSIIAKGGVGAEYRPVLPFDGRK